VGVAVYAQAVSLSGVPWSERLERAIQCELFLALRGEDGFSGALSLVRREAEEILLLVFWETESQAAAGPGVPSLAAFLDEAGTAGSTESPPGVWEVGARA
jgi:hypothetical protein